MPIPSIKSIIGETQAIAPTIAPISQRIAPGIKQTIGQVPTSVTATEVAEKESRISISPMDVIREIPKSIGIVAKFIPETFLPAITEFFKQTGEIYGEGLAYLLDENVRTQYKAGNLEILPRITKTSITDVAKKTGGAMIEATVYKILPSTIKRALWARFGIGALQGLGFAVSEGLAKDLTPEEIIDRAKLYGPIAGAVDIVAPYLGPLLRSNIKGLPKLFGQSAESVAQEIARPFTKQIGKAPIKVPAIKATIEAVEVPIRPKIWVKPIPKGKVAGVAKSIEAKAIERNMAESFADIAEYTPVTIRGQAKMMSDIMTADIEMAKRMATGKQPLPRGLKGATTIKAMEDFAMETGDGKLARELANSPLITETSEAGQTLRLLAERNPDSATAKIAELKAERIKFVEKKLRGTNAVKAKADMKAGLVKKIAKEKPKKHSWDALIDEIIC